MFADLLRRWIGAALITVGAVATVWLAIEGKLDFYIHPRYTVFSVSLALLALVIVVAAAAGVGPAESHSHGGAEVAAEPTRGRRKGLLVAFQAVLLACAVLATLVLAPASLSARIRQDRNLVSAGQGVDTGGGPVLVGGDPATYSVKDWAALLREGGPEAVMGQTLTASGYVLDGDDADTFYLVRLMMTCCAVDARPVGIPISRPNWRAEMSPGDWVALEGTFATNPEQNSRATVVVIPKKLTRIDEPAEPYVF